MAIFVMKTVVADNVSKFKVQKSQYEHNGTHTMVSFIISAVLPRFQIEFQLSLANFYEIWMSMYIYRTVTQTMIHIQH